MPKLSLLVDELNQVQQEFGNIDFDKAENTICVVTEPINLEGLYLGPFKIQLELDKLSELHRSRTYRIIALDPNPAATAEDVTHPHVSKVLDALKIVFSVGFLKGCFRIPSNYQ